MKSFSDRAPGSEGDDGRRADKTASFRGRRAQEAEEEAECDWPPQVSTVHKSFTQYYSCLSIKVVFQVEILKKQKRRFMED